MKIQLTDITGFFTYLASYVLQTRNINTSAPLSGGGDLSADRTISLSTTGTAGTYGSATTVPVFTTDAYGRVSGVTNTAITYPAVTNITGNAGTATKLQTARTFTLTGDGTIPATSFDGSANFTAAFTLSSVGTAGTYGDATHVPVFTTDAKGRVTGVTSTAITFPTVTNITGNAATATALQTARTISTLTGDVTSPGASFNGTANETAVATLATVLTTTPGSYGSTTTVPVITVNAKGLITAAAGATIAFPSSITGNAATATALQTARTLSYTGDVTGGATSFDGTANISTALTLATTQTAAHTWSAAQTLSGGISGNTTLTGTLTASSSITSTAGNLMALNNIIDNAAGTNRQFLYRTAGSNRWILIVNSTAESGSNAGSDLQIRNYADDGTTLLNATVVTRATGNWAFPTTVSVAGLLTIAPKTVSALGAAGTVGRKGFVSDATATTFASVVVGGGTNKVPVYDNGTNWCIG